MIAYKSGPRLRRGPETECTPHRRIRGRRPWCKLHCQAVVNQLPRGCPHADPDPLGWVFRQECEADARLAPGPSQDLPGGLDQLERAKVCFACIASKSAHPKIKRLRAQRANAPPSQDTVRPQRFQAEPRRSGVRVESPKRAHSPRTRRPSRG